MPENVPGKQPERKTDHEGAIDGWNALLPLAEAIDPVDVLIAERGQSLHDPRVSRPRSWAGPGK